METDRLRHARLRSHLLARPARDLAAAARRMAATQAQEFWGGRWALALRTAGEPALAEVDAAFESGALVRSWTQRGTLHIVAAEDLAWILGVTAARQERQAAGVRRGLGIDDAVLARAERTLRPALAGGGRLTRGEVSDAISAAGVEVAGARGSHVLSALAVRGVLALGPVIARADAPSREQYVVAADEVQAGEGLADPLAELLVRYLAGHGPATLEDFCWWSGLPRALARAARDGAGDRLVEQGDGLFDVAGGGPGASDEATRVLALPPFDEYYLSYADRAVAGPPELRGEVGPTANGLVRPVILADGAVIGTWRHSLAVGSHHLPPEHELFRPDGVSPPAASVDAALARFRRFLDG